MEERQRPQGTLRELLEAAGRFSLQGRLRRKAFAMLVAAPSVLFCVLPLSYFAGGPETFLRMQTPFWTAMTLLALTLVLGAGRRLHDLGQSAWWLLVLIIPATWIFFFFALSILPGEVGTNRYGPDPRGTVLPARA